MKYFATLPAGVAPLELFTFGDELYCLTAEAGVLAISHNGDVSEVKPAADAMNVWLPNTWFSYVPKPPPTEEEKAIHRAMSFNDGDGKRFGHGPVFGSDE